MGLTAGDARTNQTGSLFLRSSESKGSNSPHKHNLPCVIITEMPRDRMLGEVKRCWVDTKQSQSPNPTLCHRQKVTKEGT